MKMVARLTMLKTVFAVSALFIGIATFADKPAVAAVCPIAIVNNVVPSFGCELGSTNNDQPFGQVNADNIFGVSDWSQVAGPTNVNALAGDLTLPSDFWDIFEQGMLVLKGGAASDPSVYVAYLLLEAGGLEIDWTTPFVNTTNQNPAEVSHTSLYGTLTPVPLPGAVILFLSALAGLGLFARRKTLTV